MIADTTVLAYGGLLVTAQHRHQMVGNKSCGYVLMDPRDFLNLACESTSEKMEIMQEAAPLQTYNDYALAGKNLLPPWLDIETQKAPMGRVIGHEGRHRAAACVAAKVLKMPVFLIKREHGVAIWRRPKTMGDKFSFRLIGPQDFPEYALGQGSSARVRLPLETWESAEN